MVDGTIARDVRPEVEAHLQGCVGCRGLVDKPNTNAAKDVMAEFGLTVEDVLREFRLFQGIYKEVSQEA